MKKTFPFPLVPIVVSLIILGVLVLFVNLKIVERKASEISVGEPIAPGDTLRQALLVIDIQEGLTGGLSGIDHYRMNAAELIGAINQAADSSVYYGIPVIYVKSEVTNALVNFLNSSLAAGSPGAAFDARLKLASGHIIIKHKGDAFSNPGLDSILIKNRINRLVFTGLDLSECIYNTMAAAQNRGYSMVLIPEALLSRSDTLKDEMLGEFRQKGYDILSLDDYFEQIRQQN